jgi:hypothetical protein
MFNIITTMTKIQIKTATFPTRCEICHQTDRFDAGRNHCSRCETTNISTKPSNLFKSSDKLTLHVKLGLSNFDQAQQELFCSNEFLNNVFKIIRIGAFIVGLIILGIYVNVFLGYCFLKGISYAVYHTPPIMLVAFSLSLFSSFGHKLVPAIAFKMLKDFHKNATYTFLYDGFEMTDEKSVSKTTWENLRGVVETKHNFILFISKTDYRVIPKNFFNHYYEVEALRELLKTKLGNKVKLKIN